jgi:hypothetical protein
MVMVSTRNVLQPKVPFVLLGGVGGEVGVPQLM